MKLSSPRPGLYGLRAGRQRKMTVQTGSNTARVSWFYRMRAGVGLFFLAFVSILSPVAAAGLPYQASTSNIRVVLQPNESRKITLSFQNVGTQTWVAGRSATALFLYGTSSVFGHASWLKNDLPAVINEAKVAPGKTATASFYVRAPQKPGEYTERFLLSNGLNSWTKGSTVTVTFFVSASATVAPAPTPIVTPAAANTSPATSDAISDTSGYRAQLVDKGGVEWQMMPEEHVMVEMKFKNTGTKIWKRDGTNHLSLYTWSPKYRQSLFEDYSWKSDSLAGGLVEAEVKPGQIGTIRVELRGAEKDGLYQETFQLAAEDAAWIYGGGVTLPIRVSSPSGRLVINSQSPSPSTSGSTTANRGTYQTVLMLTSQKQITLSGNGRLQITQGFKNAGTAPWSSRNIRLVSVQPSLGTLSNVRDDSWPTTTETQKAMDVVQPGQIGFITYTIKAPTKKGTYSATLKLVADGQEVDGGNVDLPITVTADGYVDPTPISVPGPIISPGLSSVTPAPLNGDYSSLPVEPIMRVGLYRTTDDTVIVRGVTVGMKAFHNGTQVCRFGAGQSATVTFSRSSLLYTLQGSGCETQRSAGQYVLVADDGISPLEITDYSRPVAWLPGANDNTFRGKLELRYTPSTSVVWVINELPFEYYLRGIAETSDVSPLEFQKTLLTAARTYGLYHIQRGTKHANEFFHVDAHLDQVYRGYGQEARSPHIVDGVIKTRGQIVTYGGKLAITPYFSRSDGRTRDWTEVWGGTGYAWLKSVPVTWDAGQTLWGHGVGMSARGALYMASRDAKTYDQILKHFYIGTELRMAYK